MGHPHEFHLGLSRSTNPKRSVTGDWVAGEWQHHGLRREHRTVEGELTSDTVSDCKGLAAAATHASTL